MRATLLLVSLLINCALAFLALSTGLVTRATPHLNDIACTHCAEPETQHALVAAALKGQDLVYAGLPNSNAVLGLALANVMLLAFALYRKAP